MRSRHNTLFAQTKPASRNAYTVAAQPERAFHSICCVYISQPDQLYHHIPDSAVEIPDLLHLSQYPLFCSLIPLTVISPFVTILTKKRQYIPAMQGHIIALTAACYKTYILEFFISLACKELYILSCTDSNTCHRLLCSHCIDAGLFLDKLLKTSEQ